jgi:hypothetical protein
VAGITLFAVPAALADDAVVIPAGDGCAFDVLVEQTVGAPGDRVPIGFADYTFTNVDTGDSYLQKSRVVFTETFDPETNSLLFEVTGRFYSSFFVGDQGPEGEVEFPGLLLAFKGSIQFTLGLDTGLYTAFSYQGKSVDICAELAD